MSKPILPRSDGPVVMKDHNGFPFPHSLHAEMTEAIRLLTEAKYQAGCDLCGDHRTFILPRIERAWLLLVSGFPACAVVGMREAKDAWGDPVMEAD